MVCEFMWGCDVQDEPSMPWISGEGEYMYSVVSHSVSK